MQSQLFTRIHSGFCGNHFSCRADGGLAPTEGNDDGIVGGPRTPQQIAAQKRLQQTQAQVDEVNAPTITYPHAIIHTNCVSGATIGLPIRR